MASRYFSSSPRAGSGAGGSVLATGELKSIVNTMVTESPNVRFVASACFGYGCYLVSNYVESRKKNNALEEAIKLRRDRHEEVVAKAKSVLRGKK
ncbi:PREDICTED: uncharacterized protein LOC109131015 isoform X2 [Camelina sativa]|nr:PREDICTED: uncharacterized protein LOC109131015 isoform X2 [Camelina sativa]